MDYATVDEATLRAVAAAWAGEGHEQQPPAADKDDSATPSERALKPVSPLGNASEKTAVKVERGDEVPADGRAIAHLKAQVRMRTVSARLRAAALEPRATCVLVRPWAAASGVRRSERRARSCAAAVRQRLTSLAARSEALCNAGHRQWQCRPPVGPDTGRPPPPCSPSSCRYQE